MPSHQLTQDDLYNVEKIIEIYSCNDRLRSDGGVQKSSENSTDAVTNKKQAQEHAQNPD